MELLKDAAQDPISERLQAMNDDIDNALAGVAIVDIAVQVHVRTGGKGSVSPKTPEPRKYTLEEVVARLTGLAKLAKALKSDEKDGDLNKNPLQ